MDANGDQADDDCNGVGNACEVPQDDGDGDGVADVNDNCVSTANARQRDEDSDGRGDACDVCPFVADDGLDSDGDGIGDACQLELAVQTPQADPVAQPDPTNEIVFDEGGTVRFEVSILGDVAGWSGFDLEDHLTWEIDPAGGCSGDGADECIHAAWEPPAPGNAGQGGGAVATARFGMPSQASSFGTKQYRVCLTLPNGAQICEGGEVEFFWAVTLPRRENGLLVARPFDSLGAGRIINADWRNFAYHNLARGWPREPGTDGFAGPDPDDQCLVSLQAQAVADGRRPRLQGQQAPNWFYYGLLATSAAPIAARVGQLTLEYLDRPGFFLPVADEVVRMPQAAFGHTLGCRSWPNNTSFVYTLALARSSRSWCERAPSHWRVHFDEPGCIDWETGGLASAWETLVHEFFHAEILFGLTASVLYQPTVPGDLWNEHLWSPSQTFASFDDVVPRVRRPDFNHWVDLDGIGARGYVDTNEDGGFDPGDVNVCDLNGDGVISPTVRVPESEIVHSCNDLIPVDGAGANFVGPCPGGQVCDDESGRCVVLDCVVCRLGAYCRGQDEDLRDELVPEVGDVDLDNDGVPNWNERRGFEDPYYDEEWFVKDLAYAQYQADGFYRELSAASDWGAPGPNYGGPSVWD